MFAICQLCGTKLGIGKHIFVYECQGYANLLLPLSSCCLIVAIFCFQFNVCCCALTNTAAMALSVAVFASYSVAVNHSMTVGVYCK